MDSYNEWADVKVTATANKGYVFEGWSGDATEKSNSVTIKMSGSRNKRLTANFKAPTIGTFKDSRDGKTYKSVKVGGKTWMAENLNFAAEGSKCYGNDAGNCEKYGRLYDWATALKACPAGFHLPSDDEWTALTDAVGGSSTAGTKLKSAEGWNNNGNGTDDYGFGALPGGIGNSDGDFSGAGNSGYWWSATEINARIAWYRGMFYDVENVRRNIYIKAYLFSVRCVQDN